MSLRIGPLYLERPGKNVPHFKAAVLLRWLAAHPGTKVWLAGTRRWSLLLLKDEGGEPSLNAKQAIAAVLDDIAHQHDETRKDT